MIRLTDEEIQALEIDNELKGYFVWCLEEVARTQLKKVFDWGELYCLHDTGGATRKAWACPICRQSLLDEVEGV